MIPDSARSGSSLSLDKAPGSVAVLGLGLIGGSIARGLASKGIHIAGYDADAATLAAARKSGVVKTFFDSSLHGIADAEWIVIAVPVAAALPLLVQVAHLAPDVQLITDTGSTKRSIVAEARTLGLQSRFVGSHPMAGSHLSGWEASRADLFVGAKAYITADSIAGENRAVTLAERLWGFLDATPVRIDAIDHDRMLAATSHLPHLVSTALALTLEALNARHMDLGSGGKDMLRIAAGSPALWSEILWDNADNVVAAIEILIEELGSAKAAMQQKNVHDLREFLSRGCNWTSDQIHRTPPASSLAVQAERSAILPISSRERVDIRK